jgi:hypothetical protein
MPNYMVCPSLARVHAIARPIPRRAMCLLHRCQLVCRQGTSCANGLPQAPRRNRAWHPRKRRPRGARAHFRARPPKMPPPAERVSTASSASQWSPPRWRSPSVPISLRTRSSGGLVRTFQPRHTNAREGLDRTREPLLLLAPALGMPPTRGLAVPAGTPALRGLTWLRTHSSTSA